MPTRGIRTILAMATLTAGVTWLGTGPAAAAAHDCRTAHLGSPAAALCDELTVLRLSDRRSRPLLGSADTHEALESARLAERLNLTGLAITRSRTGLSDLGGFMGTSEMPTLTRTPSRVTEVDVVKLSRMPALPGFKRHEAKSSNQRTHDRWRGYSNNSIPLEVTRPVNRIKDEVVRRTLPRATRSFDTGTVPTDSVESVSLLLGNIKLR